MISNKPTLFLILVTALFALAYLVYAGIIWPNSFFSLKYPVRGLDVSHHQGKIDWQQVAALNRYSFVYIKSTEGHDFIDPRFAENWREAKRAGLLVGAYHFFSMRSPGIEQAKYFAKAVPIDQDSLPPVIDIEISTKYDPAIVRVEIDNLIKELEKHYGRRPILYLTRHTYNAYIRGHFDQYQVWIRDIIRTPSLADRQWLIWQYSNRGRVDGINTLVDQNVLNGELELLMR